LHPGGNKLNPGRAKKAEESIAEAVKTLDQILQHVSTDKNVSNYSHAIWEIFNKIEYSILMLKLHLGTENPGRLIEQVKTKENDRERLIEVSNEITDALNNLQVEKYLKALESARRARNILHATLLVIRKIRIKQI
tara:strand:- start:78 stop:485 length:408 start_codon:yes stop_codon:yes gene_type:complete